MERRNNLSPSLSTVAQGCRCVHTNTKAYKMVPTEGAARTDVRCLRSHYSWRLISLGILKLNPSSKTPIFYSIKK